MALKIPEQFTPERPQFLGEEHLHDGPANHLLRFESVGGWLYLTDKRLFFRSHKFNIQTHEISVWRSEIMEVRRYRPMMIFSTGLRVELRSGDVHRFVVTEPDRWCDKINAAHGL